MAAPNPGKKSELFTTVELIVSAKDLLNLDATSKSDPICVLYQKQAKTNELIEVGRTEIIKDNLNPTWDKKFSLEYRFEEKQELKFAIYDWDGDERKITSLGDHDYLGSLNCSLGEIVAAPFSKFERDLELPSKVQGKQKEKSKIVVYSEELGTNKETFQMTISGKGLDKKDLLGKSDPFLTISKMADMGEWTKVYATEVIKKNLDPEWRPIVGQTVTFTGKNPERRLLFQVYDHDKNGKHDLIGQFETSFLEIKTLAKKKTPVSFPLINPKKKEKKKNYEHSGILNILSLNVEETEQTFVDYIQTGVQLHFTVAIDFTASNGNPNDAKSLHCMLPNQDNQYSVAVKAVGSIIEDYDFDKQFPGLGFGAKIPPSTEVSHLFFLNFDPKTPFCSGVDGVLEAYQQALKKVKLYGPTNFAPVINHVAGFANTYQDSRHYFVLLIITDGMICDLDATREAIVKASTLPLSIIIVGVGNEDFSSMEFLDGDKRALKHNGVLAARDIVQFVALRDFVDKHGVDQASTKAALAQTVLAEIPGQLLQYMQQRNSTNL